MLLRFVARFFFSASVLFWSTLACASSGGAKIVNYYELILAAFGVDEHLIHDWTAVLGGLLSLAIITVIGLAYRKSVESSLDSGPTGKADLSSVVETIIEFVTNLARDVIGSEHGARFFPLLCGLFVFILVSNLTGLVPGFPPATESLSTNLTMGLSVFVIYNWVGFKEHGSHYFKQFLGPVAFMMPIMLVIELVAHLARPVSLSLRLYGNIFGDHLVLSVFTGLTYLVLPAFLLFFGLLVASLQSFVFTLLSSIYISMALSHDH